MLRHDFRRDASAAIPVRMISPGVSQFQHLFYEPVLYLPTDGARSDAALPPAPAMRYGGESLSSVACVSPGVDAMLSFQGEASTAISPGRAVVEWLLLLKAP